jgi:methionine-rich copper-binding protein CopC
MVLYLSVLFIGVFLFCGAASAATINVNNSTGIQNAINTAANGDTLNLSTGTYYEHDITVNKNLTLSGPQSIGNNPPTAVIDAQKQGRVFNIPVGVNVTFQYLLIQNGGVETGYDVRYGGGIYNNGTLNIENCTIQKNTAYSSGGGIYNHGGTVTLNYSNIYNNTALDYGAGLYNNDYSTATLWNSNVYFNTADSGSGIYNHDGTVTLNDSNIYNNTAPSVGGGICNYESGYDSIVTLTKSNIYNNTANSGGGIYNYVGILTLNDSNIYNNTANSGGGIFNVIGTVTLWNSNVDNNTAQNGNGGGIYNIGYGNVTMNDSNIYFNTAPNGGGGGIYNYDHSAVTLNDSNIFNNTAIWGGGIVNDYGSNVFIRFSRIIENTANQGSAIYNEGETIDATLNWWGDNNNPITKTFGSVNLYPWLVLTVTANPSLIENTGTSNITVDLLHDFINHYHDPVNGHVPDGIPVIFSTTKGTINSPLSTVNGTAKATLTGGSVSGVADVSAAVDSATAHTSVNIIDTIPPTITTIDPANNANNVPSNKVITVTFNENIKNGTGWIDLKNSSGILIPTTMSFNDNLLTITPTNPLAEYKYTLYIHTGSITDMAGNPVATKSSKFIVGTSPTVTTVDPANNAVNVARNKVIKVTFNEPIKTGTMWIDLKDNSGTLITTTKSVSGNVLTITPSALLATGTKYTLSLHTGAVTDLAGNPVAAYSSKFTTITDGTAPTVTIVDPANNTLNVPTNKVINITFSENIKNGTGWVELKNSSGTVIASTTAISGNTLTITPNSLLAKGVKYSVIIHSGAVTDTAGNPVAAYTSKFTTTTT